MLASTEGGRNTWLVGDEREVIAVDAVADPDVVLGVADGRRVVAVVCTTDPRGNLAVVDLGSARAPQSGPARRSVRSSPSVP